MDGTSSQNTEFQYEARCFLNLYGYLKTSQKRIVGYLPVMIFDGAKEVVIFRS